MSESVSSGPYQNMACLSLSGLPADNSPTSSGGEPQAAAEGDARAGDAGASGKAANGGREDWMTKPMGRSLVAPPVEKEAENMEETKPDVSVRSHARAHHTPCTQHS